MAKKLPPRLETVDPLDTLTGLAETADRLAAELYGLPCCREADQPCRLPGQGRVGPNQSLTLDALSSDWCWTCRAWWVAHRTAHAVVQCVRVERDRQAEQHTSSHPVQDPKGIWVGPMDGQ